MSKKKAPTKAELLAASKRVLAEIDRLALVCDGSEDLRKIVRQIEEAA